MEKIPVSVGILTFNSADSLTRALESVKDFDDIIICDGGSSDSTLEIAKRYGANIVTQDAKFKNPDNTLADYSGVRNQCLAVAKYDWFLYIDSDESISSELHEEIRRIASQPVEEGSPLVYRVPQIMIMDGTLIRYSSNYPGYQHRFFNRKSGSFFGKPVHEKIYFDRARTPIGTLKGAWHTYRTKQEWIHYYSRMRKYRDKEVRMSQDQPALRYFTTSIPASFKASLGALLRGTGIYIAHGFKETIPVRGELGRVFSPLAVLGRLTLALFGKRIP